MLRLERVSKIYSTGEVLRDVTWEVKTGDRIGLVGVNGAGKTTQFKIIAGLEELTTGKLVFQGEPHIAYLQQEFDVDVNRTLKEELFQAFSEAAYVLKKLRETEQLMESKKASEDNNYLDSLIISLGNLQNKFEVLQGYELEAKIEKILPKIGFTIDQLDSLVGSYSGGWQMRIALGKILLQEPDLLLLDEPTNHLDLETIEWLENYLIKQQIAIIIISHDRSFLDKICTQIVNTERGISKTYLGNYTNYVEQKKIESEAKHAAYERQQKDLANQQVFIERFRASANRSTQAKSREKMLEKIIKIEEPLDSLKRPNFYFLSAPRPGSLLVKIDNLTHSYSDNILFLDASLEVEPGDRIAFVGANGSGKSTLLRLIMGIEKPDEGLVEFGKYNVIPSYFEQNQAEALDLDKSVINTFFELVPEWTQTQVRSLLGSFGIHKEEVFKEVGQLSGGEKARVALALMLVKPSNLLILDEPTNHLDIPAKEMLEEALNKYEGASLIVSHDRYFLSKVANRIVELKDGQLIMYRGDYKYYQDKKREERIAFEEQIEVIKREAKRLKNRDRQRKKKRK